MRFSFSTATRRALHCLTISSLCLLATTVHAQEASPLGSNAGNAAAVAASYEVSSLQATVNEARAAQGSFLVTNKTSTVQGDVRYKVQLLGPLPEIKKNTIIEDTGPLYFQVVAEPVVTIPAGGTASSQFTVNLPPVPGGNYRLRIQLLNSQGREDAWLDSPIVVPGDPDTPFVNAEPRAIEIPGSTQAQVFRSGPNTPPNTVITLPYVLTNPSTAAVTGTPTLKVYEFAITRPVIATLTGDPVTIPAGQTINGTIAVTTAARPEAYEAHLQLTDTAGALVSTDAEYRWVVTGASAEIVSAQFTTLNYAPGDTVVAYTTVVGAADGETIVAGVVEMALRDHETTVETFSQPVTLTQAVQGLEGRFILDRALTAPGLVVTIKDSTGATLDAYSLTLPAQTASPSPVPATQPLWQTPLVASIALVILVVIVVIIAWLLRRASRPPTPPGGMTTPVAPLVVLLLLAAGILAIGTGYRPTVRAAEGLYLSCTSGGINGCQNPDNIRVFINSPHHQSTVADTANVTITYKVEGRSSCGNTDERILEQIEYLGSGGFVGPHNKSCASFSLPGEQWVSFPGLEHDTTASTSWRVLNRMAVLDMSNPHPGAQTTVRLLGWRTDPVDAGDNACSFVTARASGKRYEAESWAHGYLWLSLADTLPQCSDTRDNDTDNLVDTTDPGCHTDGNAANTASYDPLDNDERDSAIDTPTVTPIPTPPQCSDQQDNDGDARIDCLDPGCWTDLNNPNSCDPLDNNEGDPACSDTRDNDGDEKIDQADPGCRTSPADPSTYNPADDNETDPGLSPGPIRETE